MAPRAHPPGSRAFRPARKRLPVGEEKSRAVREMFDRIAPRYDRMNRLLTFGLDMRWRRRAVRELRLPPGSLVLDLACGTGDLCRELERAAHRAVGFDFSLGMLGAARTAAPLVAADVLCLPLADGAADGVVSGFALRNVADLAELFAEVARVVKPGGRLTILEVSEPDSTLVRFGHHFYFTRVVPAVGGWLSDRDAYRYLPRSVEYLPSTTEMLSMLRRAGFADARRRSLSGGVAQLLVGTRGPRAASGPAGPPAVRIPGRLGMDPGVGTRRDRP